MLARQTTSLLTLCLIPGHSRACLQVKQLLAFNGELGVVQVIMVWLHKVNQHPTEAQSVLHVALSIQLGAQIRMSHLKRDVKQLPSHVKKGRTTSEN